MEGRVRFYNLESGYGYIKAKDGKDVYVSKQDLLDTRLPFLIVGEIVEFDLVDSFRGPRARNVSKKECV